MTIQEAERSEIFSKGDEKERTFRICPQSLPDVIKLQTQMHFFLKMI